MGQALMYRYWATADPQEVAERWIRAYLIDERGSLILLAFQEKKGAAWQGSLLEQSKNRFIVIDQLQMEAHPSGTLVAKMRQGIKQMQFQHLYSYNLVKEMGWYGPLLSLFVPNPITRFYQLDQSNHQPLSGLMEITTLD